MMSLSGSPRPPPVQASPGQSRPLPTSPLLALWWGLACSSPPASVHAPGYPLYLSLNRLFCDPFSPFRENLNSSEGAQTAQILPEGLKTGLFWTKRQEMIPARGIPGALRGKFEHPGGDACPDGGRPPSPHVLRPALQESPPIITNPSSHKEGLIR